MKVGDQLEVKSVSLTFAVSGTGPQQWRDPDPQSDVFTVWDEAEKWLKTRQESRGDAHLEVFLAVEVEGFEDPLHKTLLEAAWVNIDLPEVKKQLEETQSKSARELDELYDRRKAAEGNVDKLGKILSGYGDIIVF